MNTKHFIKWAAALVCIVAGTIYLASAILVSEKVASCFDFRDTARPSFKIEVDAATKSSSAPVPFFYPYCCIQSINSEVMGNSDRYDMKPDVTIVEAKSIEGTLVGLIPKAIGILVFLVLVALPLWVFYHFLLCPLRDIPIVSSELINVLDHSDDSRKRYAVYVIANAMRQAEACPESERTQLADAVRNPTTHAEMVKSLLDDREKRAEEKAREIAKMAAMTTALSSSAMGDGLGMFFWKSKLVYETFRIYGFRPDAKTTVLIWMHVVFAAFFSASVEELCELFDVSELVGGMGVRIAQGAVGAAVVLKGGQLTRAYLVHGLSSESRRTALNDFRKSVKNDFGSIIRKHLEDALAQIGF